MLRFDVLSLNLLTLHFVTYTTLPSTMFATGFLPPDEPLLRLPQAEFQPWEAMATALPSLLTVGKARKPLEALPVLPVGERSILPCFPYPVTSPPKNI